MRWSQELIQYNYRIKFHQEKKTVLPDTLSRRDQNIPHGINDNRLQTRFKRLIPKTAVGNLSRVPAAHSAPHIYKKNSNYLPRRQRISKISGKFTDLGQARNNSQTPEIEKTNLGDRTCQ